MLDRMPAVAIADLKPGDMVIVSTRKVLTLAEFTALQLFGYRTAVNAMQARQAMQGGAAGREPAQSRRSEWFWNRLDFGIGLP